MEKELNILRYLYNEYDFVRSYHTCKINIGHILTRSGVDDAKDLRIILKGMITSGSVLKHSRDYYCISPSGRAWYKGYKKLLENQRDPYEGMM